MKLCLAMPSKGHETFLEAAVRSVLTAWPAAGELEFRILDAGTDEGTLVRVRRLIEDVDGAELRSKPDAGQADALRRCFAATDADILGWLNSDDLLLPGAIDHVLERFWANDSIDVLYGNALFVDAGGRCIGSYPVTGFDGQLLKSFCFLSQPSTFFRASAYAAVDGIDAGLDFALDYDLWLRLLAEGARFQHSRRVLSATRLHSSTKTGTGESQFTREVAECQQRAFPGEAVAERAAWQRYRHAYCEGGNRAVAFLVGTVTGGPLPALPRRVSWGLRLLLLHARAWLRARGFAGRDLAV